MSFPFNGRLDNMLACIGCAANSQLVGRQILPTEIDWQKRYIDVREELLQRIALETKAQGFVIFDNRVTDAHRVSVIKQVLLKDIVQQ